MVATSHGSVGSRGGNTKTPRISASMYWFFTFNNIGSKLLEFIDTLDERCEKYMCQLESGEKNTEHLQGCIKLETKGRPLEIWKEYKQIHWEKTKDIKKAVEYCCKEDTRINGPWMKGWEPEEEYDCLKPHEFNEWQKELVDIVTGPFERRVIRVYVDLDGGKGKSAIARYLSINHNALIVCGKASDMKFSITNMIKNNEKEPKICILDLPRSVEHISWGGLEEIKNGTFNSNKYESGMINLKKPPHVVVFTNHEVPEGIYSNDRLIIKNL